jgi:DNA-binding NarL/FixJ family response regulator
MIKIVLVEDNDVVRKGLTQVLSAQQDMEVVAQAINGLEAVRLFEDDIKTDIVLTDLNMPVMDGIEMTERLIAMIPDLKVIILTMHSKNAFADRAEKAGAKGYVLKHAEMDELYHAIRTVHAG